MANASQAAITTAATFLCFKLVPTNMSKTPSKILHLFFMCLVFLYKVNTESKMFEIIGSKSQFSVIKILQNILLTACYDECSKTLLCQEIGFTYKNDDSYMVDCYLIEKAISYDYLHSNEQDEHKNLEILREVCIILMCSDFLNRKSLTHCHITVDLNNSFLQKLPFLV